MKSGKDLRVSDHRRTLSKCIVDLSSQGDQPLQDQDGSIHAVVTGEIYNDEPLREQCIQEFGYNFSGHSDSELVVALYKHHGAPGFLEHLRGEFAFVIYDERSGEVIAARDRFGVKPLFWTMVEDRLLFASEIKAFLPLGWKAEWDVHNLVRNSCFVGSDTWFKGVKRVSIVSTALLQKMVEGIWISVICLKTFTQSWETKF